MFLKIRCPQNPFQIPISVRKFMIQGTPMWKRFLYRYDLGTWRVVDFCCLWPWWTGPSFSQGISYFGICWTGPALKRCKSNANFPHLVWLFAALIRQYQAVKCSKISKSAMLSKAHGKALAFVIAAVIFSGILRFLLPGWGKLRMSRTTKQEYYFGMRRWSYGKLMKALFSMMTRHADSLGDMVCSCFFVRSTWNNVFLDWRSESSLASSKFIGSNSRGWSVGGSV